MPLVLAINPGSTSTKVAVFDGVTAVFAESIAHSAVDLAPHARIADQYALRRDAVLACLVAHGVPITALSAIVGRGGMLRPVPGGTFRINTTMLDELRTPGPREHAANLGAIVAHEIASQASLPAFIVDPVCVDEFEPLARISGLPEIERRSYSHALNLKAMARRAAADLGQPYESLDLIVVHMGGGISVSPHRHGRMIDVNQALDGTGPFSPERAGGLPVGDVLRLSFSGRYTYDEFFRRIAGQGGLVAHLGTNNAVEVEQRIAAGDAHARLIYEAMAYQTAKEIGGMATVLCGHVDAIVLTGGLAHSDVFCNWLRERLSWIAPILIYPGQDEMRAMVEGVLRVLTGEEQAQEY
ncbi:MAG TPA: butyrate kinase [Anaerolineae bacterium]|nr:butyrate kinase [Anaerolineae bacterium]HPL27665.1 butyrate kinase [Anaerolineae bacterium]